MKSASRKAVFLMVICLLAFHPMAFAQTVGPQAMISNLDQPWPGPPGTAGDFHGVPLDSGFGFAFTTGSSQFMLDTVTFEELDGPSSTAQVELLASQGGIFSAVDQLGSPAVDPRPTQFPTITSFIDYTPVTPITLMPDTSYLVAFFEPSNGDSTTTLTFNANGYTVSSDWSVYGAQPTLDYSGASPPDTVSSTPFGPGWRRYPSEGIVLEIDATPVPEPGVGKMFFALFGTLGLFRLLKYSINRWSVI